jgi:hypothetical protein
MIEAYKVGVEIALQGGINAVIEQLVRDFSKLDKAIQSTQSEINSLVSGMRALNREGQRAADTWSRAASQMERAAKAARAAGDAMGRASRGAAGFGGGGGSEGGGGGGSVGGGRQERRGNTPLLALPAPYTPNSNANGGGGGNGLAPYVYSGDAIPPSPGSAPFGGYLGAPQGPTINGTAGRPGAGGPTYGPYGTPFGGQGGGNLPAVGGGGMGGGNMPAGGGGPGGRPGGPGGPGGGGPFNLNSPFPPNLPGGGGLHGTGLMSMAVPGYFGARALGSIFAPTSEMGEHLTALIKMGFTPEQAKAIEQSSFDIQRDVRGTSVIGNIHLAEKLMTVTQNPEVASNPDLMKILAKYYIESMQPGKRGEGADLDAAIRAAEYSGNLLVRDKVTGKENADMPKLLEFLNTVLAVNTITEGDINAKNILQTLRSSGGGGAFMSNDELIRQTAMGIALGSAKTGTAIQGFEQQFQAGRMSEAGANLALEMNMIHGGKDAKHNPFLRKMGVGQFLMLPGAMDPKIQNDIATDPTKMINEYFLPKFRDYAKGVYGDSYNGADDRTKSLMEGRVAQMLASRIPGATEMVEAIRNFSLIERDMEAAIKARSRDIFKITNDNNPAIPTMALHSSLQAFEIRAGEAALEPAIRGLDKLSSALNTLSTWAHEHEGLTRTALEGFAGAVIGLGTAAAIAGMMAIGALPATLIALGPATAAAVEGIKAFEGFLRETFPGFMKGGDKTLQDIKKDGVGVWPWWMPLPAPPGSTRSKAPFSLPGGIDPSSLVTPGPLTNWLLGKSNAPPSSGIGTNDKGTESNPVVVHVQNQVTGSEIATGVSSNLADRMNRPQSGMTGSDLKMNLSPAYQGALVGAIP